jgi:hypothetical protein
VDVFEKWRVATYGDVGRALRIQVGENFQRSPSGSSATTGSQAAMEDSR